MARDRTTPSFSVEIRNSRQRSSVKRGWADEYSLRLTKTSPIRPPSSKPHEARSVFRSTADDAHVTDVIVRPAPKVLPDLSRDAKEASRDLGNFDDDLPMKPKRAYRKKEHPAEPHMPKTVDVDALRPTIADEQTAPFILHPPVIEPPSVESVAVPMRQTVEVRRGRDTADGEVLRPGERWKRRLSKYSR
jgi:hypothetical protein